MALRWVDIHLDEVPPRLEVTGTLAYSKKYGNHRANEAKTSASHRVIQLDASALKLLRRRREEYGEHLQPVFPSGAGSFIWENNFNRKLRKWRGDAFDWVTVHTIRKTFATVIANELGAYKASQILGHVDSTLTERVYCARPETGVSFGDLMERFRKSGEKQPDIVRLIGLNERDDAV